MSVFQKVNFDNNEIADAACDQLFQKASKSTSSSKKNKSVLSGRISKRKKKQRHVLENGQIFKKGVTNILDKDLQIKQKITNSRSKNNKVKIQADRDSTPKKSKRNKNVANIYQRINNETINIAENKQTNRKRKMKKNTMIEASPNNTENVSRALNFRKTIDKPKKVNKIKAKLKQTFDTAALESKQDSKRNNNVRQLYQNINNEAINPAVKKRKRKKVKDLTLIETSSANTENVTSVSNVEKLTYKQKKNNKIKEKLQQALSTATPRPKRKVPVGSLRARMMERLQAARFRYINEQIYSNHSKEAQKMFKEDPDAFKVYHEGFRRQVNKWPMNPLDVIISSIQKMPKTHVIADFGCGEAQLAKSVQQEVHSFDLVSMDEVVTVCDMAHVPLPNSSVNVVVFCLSLMGTNLHDYLLEANRILKVGGLLKIAEVESRFEGVNVFIEGLRRFNFKNTWKDLSHNLFYFLDFKKESNITNKKKLPTISLHPCLYKRR